MKNIEELLLEGHTVYINSINGIVIGTGIKYLGNKGTSLYEVSSEDINNLAEKYPTILEELNKGNLLQIYITFNHYYRVTLGKEIGEGPYGERKAFDVIEDLNSYSLDHALELLECETKKLLQDSNRKTLKRMYRLYGNDRYETYKEVI